MKLPWPFILKTVAVLSLAPLLAYSLGLVAELMRVSSTNPLMADSDTVREVQEISLVEDPGPSPATPPLALGAGAPDDLGTASVLPTDPSQSTPPDQTGIAAPVYEFFTAGEPLHRAGDGLHYYVLLAEPNDRASSFLADLFGGVAPLSEMAKAYDAYRPNTFHLPVRDPIGGQDLAQGKGAAFAETVLAHYDYDWARKSLIQLCARHRGVPAEEAAAICNDRVFNGPYLVTLTSPISALGDGKEQALIFDMSAIGETAFEPFLQAHKTQARRPEVEPNQILETFRLTLLNLDLKLKAPRKDEPLSDDLQQLAFADGKRLLAVGRSDFAS
ncbi:MAG: hypothetical protein AAGF19_11675 [Pseudomonadota bacterium]